MGALTHQGKIDPSQPTEKSKTPRDPKRRTVQVEYVAPQSQTARGETTSSANSPATDRPTVASSAGQSKGRVRTAIVGSEDGQYNPTIEPLPQEPSTGQSVRSSQTYDQGTSRAQYRSGIPQRDMAPPTKPQKDIPRSVSDSTSAFGHIPNSIGTRPTTGSSMTSTAHGRLPSRGNSYSQPLAPTVAPTNAEGRLAQPKGGKQYNISAPIPQAGINGQNESVGLPSTQRYGSPTLGPQRDPPRSHKRSNTLGNFFRTGSISGGRSQPQSPGEPPREKRYPPTSMKAPMDSPRQSTDSRRPSFSFGRKSSDLRKTGDLTKQEKSRRFSILPASFSLKSFTSAGSAKDPSTVDMRPTSERKQSNVLEQIPSSRPQSRPQTMAYTRGASGGNSYGQEENIPAGFDGFQDLARDSPVQQTRRKDVPSRGGQQNQYNGSQYQTEPNLYPPSRLPQPGQSYLGTPTDSEISVAPRRDRPSYPQGFNEYEGGEPSLTSLQQSRSGRGPNVLQKNNRRFADAYEQDAEPGYGAGGSHAGTSGAAKRVMDFFRRRGKARSGDER